MSKEAAEGALKTVFDTVKQLDLRGESLTLDELLFPEDSQVVVDGLNDMLSRKQSENETAGWPDKHTKHLTAQGDLLE